MFLRCSIVRRGILLGSRSRLDTRRCSWIGFKLTLESQQIVHLIQHSSRQKVHSKVFARKLISRKVRGSTRSENALQCGSITNSMCFCMQFERMIFTLESRGIFLAATITMFFEAYLGIYFMIECRIVAFLLRN